MNNQYIVLTDSCGENEYTISVDEYGLSIVACNEEGKVSTSFADWGEDVVLVNAVGLLVEKLNLVMNNASLFRNNPPSNDGVCKALQ